MSIWQPCPPLLLWRVSISSIERAANPRHKKSIFELDVDGNDIASKSAGRQHQIYGTIQIARINSQKPTRSKQALCKECTVVSAKLDAGDTRRKVAFTSTTL